MMSVEIRCWLTRRVAGFIKLGRPWLAVGITFGLLLAAAEVMGEDMGPPGDSGAQLLELDSSNLLILANAESPCSLAVVELYRQYHPEITDEQVLYLSGLPDSASITASPETEIITRDDFENLIAQPTRNYMASHQLINTVFCIVTTAGMPYRIEDTDPELADVVQPAASDAMLTVDHRHQVNAASVESELAVLFQIAPALPSPPRMPIEGRLVNPYQGYCSPIKSWAGQRDVLARRQMFQWTFMWRVTKSPKIEGEFDIDGRSAVNRCMSPADIYLVARLDGPRAQGELPTDVIYDMLDRAAAVSNPDYHFFIGYNPAITSVVIDESSCAGGELAYTQVYNFPPPYGFICYNDFPTPPGAEEFGSEFNEANHFERAFTWLTGLEPPADETVVEPFEAGLGGLALWDDTCSIMNSDFLPNDIGLLGLLTYGRNGGDGRPRTYLLTSGPGGGPLFACAPGAVFASLESFNAVTMFTDVTTSQGKIAEFIEMGGSAAIGHAFEPAGGAVIQGDFLLRNLLRDEDGDGVGDLTLVEAAFSAVPYLSWSEVLIGDPLMRLHTGPGGLVRDHDLVPPPILPPY